MYLHALCKFVVMYIAYRQLYIVCINIIINVFILQSYSDSSVEGGPAQPHEHHYEHYQPCHTPQQSFQGLQSKVP